jgi:LysM repeat protein
LTQKDSFDLYFRVAEGETLGIIAAKYKTTIEDILTLNKVSYFTQDSNSFATALTSRELK